jgi:hypothetical protein
MNSRLILITNWLLAFSQNFVDKRFGRAASAGQFFGKIVEPLQAGQ